MTRSLAWIACVTIIVSWPVRAVCEDLDAPEPDDVTSSNAYQLDLEHFSIRLGGGLLIDYATYNQNADSKEQMDLSPEGGIRDLRGLASGRLPWSRLTYTVGYMLDVSKNDWVFRQTGLKVAIPELGGFLFLGRTKEGFSTNKFMVGYHGWFNERGAASDSFIPILADGVRWTASVFGGHLVYNVGGFGDAISEEQTFNRNDWQFAARAVWLPFTGSDPDHVLHFAVDFRVGGADDGQLQFRSKPESFFAQSQAVDTGKFDADLTTMVGLEAYYVQGPFSSGSEYYFNKVSSKATNNPFFHGGEAFVAYLFTGETHPYKQAGGYFEDVVPKKSFFSGGWGAWSLALRGSYVDLDSGLVAGGRFFRFTPQVNWYLTSTLRFEMLYGVSVLDRDDLVGTTQFFQTRVQISIK